MFFVFVFSPKARRSIPWQTVLVWTQTLEAACVCCPRRKLCLETKYQRKNYCYVFPWDRRHRVGNKKKKCPRHAGHFISAPVSLLCFSYLNYSCEPEHWQATHLIPAPLTLSVSERPLCKQSFTAGLCRAFSWEHLLFCVVTAQGPCWPWCQPEQRAMVTPTSPFIPQMTDI